MAGIRGISQKMLIQTLRQMERDGLVERRVYAEVPPRVEYTLTAKGRDLWPVLVALLQYGDRHYAPAGPPMLLSHRGCGGDVTARRTCARCGAELEPADVEARPGPGAAAA